MQFNRRTIYEIIEKDCHHNFISRTYDYMMMVVIFVSIIPLMFRETLPIFVTIENVTVAIFIVDYLLRWSTADIMIGKGFRSFLLYPFRPMAIIDLLSILPAWNILGQGFRIVRITRLLKILRVLRFMRYSSHISMLLEVLKKERKVLFSVLVIAVFYVFVTALIMFNAEPKYDPETGEIAFNTFFDALYWATVTLTTVGYGDICPVTDIGRCVSMFSSLFGVAIIALPSGIITASYLDELRKGRHAEEEDQF